MTKKLAALLHDITLINFAMLFKLLRRYYVVTLVVPTIMLAISGQHYLAQKTIYIKHVHFSIVSGQDNSAVSDIANLIGEKGSKSLTSADVYTLLGSWKFHKDLATSLLNYEHFDRLNFNCFSSSS